MKFQETTLTDLNILSLKRLMSRGFHVHAFSARKEAATGADMELWFQGSTGHWLGFRVQCKVIDPKTGQFERLHYYQRSTGRYQCDVLIESALRGPVPAIPLYCLYVVTPSGTRPSKIFRQEPCPCTPSRPVKTLRWYQLYGCSWLSAFEVRRRLPLRSGEGDPASRHLWALRKFLVPWHRPFCCVRDQNLCRWYRPQGDGPPVGGMDLTARLWAFWQYGIDANLPETLVEHADLFGNLLPNTRDDRAYRQLISRLGPTTNPPASVSSLVEGQAPQVTEGREMRYLVVATGLDRG